MSFSVDASTVIVNNPAPYAIDAGRRPSDRCRVNDTAERIRRLIETRGMSARSLSEAAGLSHSTVSSLLTKLDANPDARVEARTLDKIAAALKVDATWLRTGRGEMDSNASPQAPESLLRRLRATGDLSAVRLAAETGMPWWAAALRLDMTAVMP